MSADTLIRELEEISKNTKLPLEKRLIDTAVWFHKNKDRIPRENLAKRLDFLEKAFDIILEVYALTLRRLHEAEDRPGSGLWLHH